MKKNYLYNIFKLIKDLILGKYYFNILKYIPVNYNRERLFDSSLIDEKNIAIIIQGKILEEDNFTYETVKLYINYFPNTKIILSTWPNILGYDKYLALGIKVIANELPLSPGVANVNYQIASTASGIQCAKEMGSTYVLKTRTDQRIYSNLLFDYLLSLIKVFPLTSDALNFQQSRLIGISRGSFKLRLHSISDMFMFGDIRDMEKYWTCKYSPYNCQTKIKKTITWRDQISEFIPERYLMRSYLKKINYQTENTLQNSYDALVKFFCIIDHKEIGFYWHKYDINDNRYHTFKLDNPEISHLDWIALYFNKSHMILNESLLDIDIYK